MDVVDIILCTQNWKVIFSCPDSQLEMFLVKSCALSVLVLGVQCQQAGNLKANDILRVPMEECQAGGSCSKGMKNNENSVVSASFKKNEDEASI